MASARGRNDRGMTLVEVLVSLGLCGLLLSVALAIAHTMGRVHADQAQIQTVSENLGGAMAQLVRDTRLCGAGIASGVVVNAASPAPAILPAVSVQNGTGGGPDSLDLVMPAGAVATTLLAVQPGDGQVTVDAGQGAGFSAGDLALLSDYSNAVLFDVLRTGPVVSAGVPGVALQVNVAPAFPVATFPAGSLLLRASSVRYAVQPGDGHTLPGSWFLMLLDRAPIQAAQPPSPLAENILDMQIAVGIDGINGFPADGVLSEVGQAPNDDEWVFNVPGESLPGPPPNPQALRINLVGRTSVTGEQPGPGRPAVEDHAAGPPDRYRWRVLTETVTLRNLVVH